VVSLDGCWHYVALPRPQSGGSMAVPAFHCTRPQSRVVTTGWLSHSRPGFARGQREWTQWPTGPPQVGPVTVVLEMRRDHVNRSLHEIKLILA
jgi:hypothetical protein